MKKLGKKFNKFRQTNESSWGRCTCSCGRYNEYSHENGTGY